MERMGEEMKSRGAADIFKWFLFMATDVIGELTFGESFRMLELGEVRSICSLLIQVLGIFLTMRYFQHQKNDYSRNLERVAAVGAKRTTFPFLAKLAQHGIPVPGLGDVSELSRKLVEYATESLQRHQKLVARDPDRRRSVPTLFTKLLVRGRGGGEEQEEGGQETLTLKEITDEAQIYIVAGSDTTALTLTFLVWSVCRQPAVVQQRLADEVRRLLPPPPGRFEDHDVQQLPYLNQVIEEALRLYPPAPSALPRVVPPGGATLSGHFLPGGSVVCTQAYSLHRNPDVFPNPDVFDPSRWEHPTKEMKDSFMAFGGGSRGMSSRVGKVVTTYIPTYPFVGRAIPTYLCASRSFVTDILLLSLHRPSPRAYRTASSHCALLPGVSRRKDIHLGRHE